MKDTAMVNNCLDAESAPTWSVLKLGVYVVLCNETGRLFGDSFLRQESTYIIPALVWGQSGMAAWLPSCAASRLVPAEKLHGSLGAAEGPRVGWGGGRGRSTA